jgi:hypothetical protein
MMLKSYEIKVEGDRIIWLEEKPNLESSRVFITIIEEKPVENTRETSEPIRRRFTPSLIAGKGKTLGDIVSPIVDEEDWECLK